MTLKGFVGRDDVAGMGCVRREPLAHNGVQLLRLLHLQHPLAVGRVAHHRGMLRLDELPHIPLFNMNPAGYAGFFCVFPGKLHAVRVNVPTVCLKVRIPADRIDGSAPFLSPDLLGNPAPFGCGKLPVDAGGNVQRLDGADVVDLGEEFEDLAAEAIFLTTICSVVTIPLMVMLLL